MSTDNGEAPPTTEIQTQERIAQFVDQVREGTSTYIDALFAIATDLTPRGDAGKAALEHVIKLLTQAQAEREAAARRGGAGGSDGAGGTGGSGEGALDDVGGAGGAGAAQQDGRSGDTGGEDAPIVPLGKNHKRTRSKSAAL